MSQEQAIQLQSDTLSSTGLPIRMVVVRVPVNAVLTDVAQQVVSIANSDGAIIDSFSDVNTMRSILVELQELRRLLSIVVGVPFLEPVDMTTETSRISGI